LIGCVDKTPEGFGALIQRLFYTSLHIALDRDKVCPDLISLPPRQGVLVGHREMLPEND
jgi:hypothetical protein